MTSGIRRHVLINSLQRSGGSLVARLLDAHPAVHSTPFELLYAPQKVRMPSDEEVSGLAGDWDRFSNTLLFRQNFQRVARHSHVNKDQYGRAPFAFDYERFEADVRAWFEAAGGGIAYADAMAASLNAFFRTWLGEAEGAPRELQVNHLSMACLASAERFFELFPDGRIVQTLRDPLSWYASMKGHFRIADLDLTYMVYALEIWIESTLRGLIAARLWPDRYTVVRYGDLVEDCPGSMKAVAAFLGTPYDEVMTRPTVGGLDWLGNSSFGPMAGVEGSSLEQWRETLTGEEVEQVRRQAGALGELVAAGGVWSPRTWPDSIQHPTTGIHEPLMAASVEDLLRNESRRMSLLTFNVFTQTVQRERGARYSKAGGRSGPVGRLRRGVAQLFK